MPGLDPGIQTGPLRPVAYYVHILAGRRNGTLYIGVTGDVVRRVHEHREGMVDGFTERHAVKRLVHFEQTENVAAAIQREKNLKHWSRAWKIALIEWDNPEWRDLWNDIMA